MTTTPGTASYRAYAGEDVITGEGVAVELPVASVPHRMASGAIDLLVIIGIVADPTTEGMGDSAQALT